MHKHVFQLWQEKEIILIFIKIGEIVAELVLEAM